MKKETKQEIADLIRATLEDLNEGKKKALSGHLKKLRILCEAEGSEIAKDVQDFITQVEFQVDYDFAHLVTEKIRLAADKLCKAIRDE